MADPQEVEGTAAEIVEPEVEEVDLNKVFADSELDLNAMFPDTEMRKFLMRVKRNRHSNRRFLESVTKERILAEDGERSA